MDTAIESRGLSLFIKTIQAQQNEEKMFDIWLHKVFDGSSFADYKKKVRNVTTNALMGEGQQKKIVQKSFEILKDFDPEGVTDNGPV